jgi:hypothetical protein
MGLAGMFKGATKAADPSALKSIDDAADAARAAGKGAGAAGDVAGAGGKASGGASSAAKTRWNKIADSIKTGKKADPKELDEALKTVKTADDAADLASTTKGEVLKKQSVISKYLSNNPKEAAALKKAGYAAVGIAALMIITGETNPGAAVGEALGTVVKGAVGGLFDGLGGGDGGGGGGGGFGSYLLWGCGGLCCIIILISIFMFVK